MGAVTGKAQGLQNARLCATRVLSFLAGKAVAFLLLYALSVPSVPSSRPFP